MPITKSTNIKRTLFVQLYIKRQIPLHIISFQGLSLSQFSTHKSHVTIIFPTFATNIYYYMYIRLYIIGCNIMEKLCNICFYYHQMQNVTTSMPHNKSSWWEMKVSWSMKFNTITDLSSTKKYTVHGKGQMLTSTVVDYLVHA